MFTMANSVMAETCSDTRKLLREHLAMVIQSMDAELEWNATEFARWWLAEVEGISAKIGNDPVV